MKKCENCVFVYYEEDGDGNVYTYCEKYDCELKEIAGLDTQQGCENYRKDTLREAIEADAHTCDYNASGECKICGKIRYKSPLYMSIYGGEYD